MGLLIEYILPMIIFLMIFSLGLTLTVRDFTRFLRHPRPILIGLLCQFLAAPCLVFALVTIFGLDGYLAMGFIILAACPGGGVSNLIVKFSNGDVPLSVSLTSVSNLLSCITLPVLLSIAASHFLTDDFQSYNATQTAVRGFLLCTLPVTLGIALRRYRPHLAARIEPSLSQCALVLLVAVIVGAVGTSWGLFIDNFVSLGGILVVLLVAMPATGYVVARLMRASRQTARTISIETGVQNGAFGIAIGAYIQPQSGFSEATLAPALYGVTMYFSVLVLAKLYRSYPVRNTGQI